MDNKQQQPLMHLHTNELQNRSYEMEKLAHNQVKSSEKENLEGAGYSVNACLTRTHGRLLGTHVNSWVQG